MQASKNLENTLQVQLEEDEKVIKLIMITFTKLWNVIIGIQSYFLAIFVTYLLAFNSYDSSMFTLIIVSDIFFLCDFIATIIYVNSAKVRRFMHYKPRNWIFIVVDFISLIPFAFAYETYMATDYKDDLTWRILLQNRCLRLYRVFLLLNMYDLTLRNAFHYVIMMLLRFAAQAGLASHILACIWANMAKSVECEEDRLYCLLWYEQNVLLLVIHNWKGSTDTLSLNGERILTIVCMICGIVVIYGHFIPYTLHVFMRVSRSKGRYYRKYLILQRYLKNISIEPALGERVRKYFKYFWLSGTMEMEMETLTKDLPVVLQKEIFTDIYWDAFQHSDIFRYTSRNFKRSLSLRMTTEYCQEGDVIYYKGSESQKMIYLVQGVLELMAEENSMSPILSFSSGTIIGEISLFMTYTTQTIVKCRTLCELHTLHLCSLSEVLLRYPKDKKLIFQNVNRRLAIAKITQWRKKRLLQEKNVDLSLVGQGQVNIEDSEDCIKWIKHQWRSIWEAHERHLLVMKANEEGFRVPAWRKEREVQLRLDAVSNYMNLMVLSDIFEEKKDVVCLKTVFPWAIDPDAEFLIYWKVIVVIFALVPSLVYPYCTGWLDKFPESVFTMSIVCTLIFEIDLALILMSAIKTKHGIITKFWSILIACLKKPTFYMDVLAALPVQVYLSTRDDTKNMSSAHVGLFLFTGILKSHVFMKPRTDIGDSMVVASLFKNVFIFILLVYWFAAVIQFSAIRCIVPCDFLTWKLEQQITVDEEFVRENLLSIFLSASVSLSISDFLITTKNTTFLVGLTIFKLFFFFCSCFLLGDFYAVYSIKTSNKLNFKLLYNRISKYLEDTHISPFVEKRLIRIIRFQWIYNEADDLLTKIPIIKLAPNSMRREIFQGSLFQTFRKCPLFEEESNELIFDLMDKCRMTAVPSGTLLVNYGTQCYRIHMLHRGYCQINSFLVKDVTGGLGAPILIKPGDLFPTLAAFITSPVPISVLTVTDCEVIMITLEDLLKTMITHNMFKDLVDVLYTNNYLEKLSKHRLAMIRINVNFNNVSDSKSDYEKQFRKYGKWGKFLRRITLPRNLFYDDNQQPTAQLKVLYHIYIYYLLTCLIMWPLSFGLLVKVSHIIIPILQVLMLYPFVYMYMRFYVPFYDSRGLLITHPTRTTVRYLTTSFPFDLLLNTPIYTVYRYVIRSPLAKDNTSVVFVQAIQKFLALVPINDFINKVTVDSNHVSSFRVLKILLIASLLVNAVCNYEMFYSSSWQFAGPYEVFQYTISEDDFIYHCYTIPDNAVLRHYLSIFFWIIGHLTTSSGKCREFVWQEKIASFVTCTVGSLATYLFFGWLAAHSVIGDTFATIYQERMKSFIEFMLTQKTDDKVVEKAIGYFEHQWARSRGQDLTEIFDRLPYYVHEELAYPLYRPTLSKTGLFGTSDEGFYKLLATHLSLVHFNRGSVIFFKGQTQSDIYFVHRGKCFVFDWFQTLEVGSMIGDIKNTGIMENKVYALTHVDLLRMPSYTFFRIINIFHDIERVYLYKANKSENFIKSPYLPAGNQLRPVDSWDVLNAFNLQSKDLGFEDQSYFEDPENIPSFDRTTKHISGRKFSFTIYPGTYAKLVYSILVQLVAFVTILILPSISYYGSLTVGAFAIIAVLDFLWLAAIVATFRVGVEDKVKGDIITEWKLIAKAFVLKMDGFFFALTACLPFELIPILIAGNLEDVNLTHVAWLRTPRLLRCYYLLKYLNAQVKKLKVSFTMRWLSITIHLICYINILVLVYLKLATNELIVSAMDPLQFSTPQISALILVYQYVFNLITSSNMNYIPHETKYQIVFFNFVAVFSIYVKAVVIKKILAIIYINGLARAKYKGQVMSLEAFLKIHDISPCILTEVLDYKLKLLIATRSENMPTFLVSAPTTLQISLMTDLYLQHLLNSPLFREVNINFLKLLVCRFKRIIFFPGQKIVEKGDVDNNMYFIHKGEVYVVEQTNDSAYVEYIVDRMYAGQQFGEAQGLYIARQHKFTYRARTLVEILILNSNDWKNLRRSYKKITDHILQSAKTLQFD